MTISKSFIKQIVNVDYFNEQVKTLFGAEYVTVNYKDNSDATVDIFFPAELSNEQNNALTDFIFNYVDPPQSHQTVRIMDVVTSSYIVSNTLFTAISSAILPSQSAGFLYKIIFVAHIDPAGNEPGPNLYYNFRIFDVINRNIIYESAIPFTNTDDQLIEVTSGIQNLPTDSTLIEFQFEKGPLGKEVQIKYIQLHLTLE